MITKSKLWFITGVIISVAIPFLSSTLFAQTSLSCGQITTGSISSTSEQDSYSISAITNDKIAIQLVRTSGDMNPYIELYDSNGSIVDSKTSDNYVVTLTTTISSDGTYKIVVSDYGKDGTGNYSLTWQKVNNPCNATALSCGQTATGSLGVIGEQDFYSISATSDDTVSIQLLRTSGNMDPYLEIYDTTGTVITSNYNTSEKEVTIETAGGNYKVAVSDYGKDETGGYTIMWQKLNDPCNVTSTSCGQTASGSLSAVGEQDFYSLTTEANDKVTIHLVRTSGSMDPYLELYDNTGSRTAGTYTTSGNEAIIDTTITAGGTFKAKVSDYGKDETGDYILAWQKLNSPCNIISSLECGVKTSGSLGSAAEYDFYTFTATADDKATITLTRTSGSMDPYLELYDNTGTRLTSNSTTSDSSTSITQSISAGKSYTVFASDYGHDETGSYTVKLQRIVDSCPEVSLSSPNGGEMIEGGASYKITWTSTSSQSISQDITLSTDGGETFPYTVVKGLSSSEQSYTWSIGKDIHTTKGRIRIKVTDTNGDTTEDTSDGNFIILQGVTMSTIKYGYDKLNRLTNFVYGNTGTTTYTYDVVGNRTSIVSSISTQITTPTPTPTSTQTCPGDGDVNEDGKLTAGDALLAFKSVLGSTTLTSCQESHADANGNGKVTAADALCIFKAVLKGESPSESLSCE